MSSPPPRSPLGVQATWYRSTVRVPESGLSSGAPASTVVAASANPIVAVKKSVAPIFWSARANFIIQPFSNWLTAGRKAFCDLNAKSNHSRITYVFIHRLQVEHEMPLNSMIWIKRPLHCRSIHIKILQFGSKRPATASTSRLSKANGKWGTTTERPSWGSSKFGRKDQSIRLISSGSARVFPFHAEA